MRRGRFHTALVYFGFRNDSAHAERLDAEPMAAWRYAAAIVIAVVGLGMALGVLALLGVHAPRYRCETSSVVRERLSATG